MAERVEPNVEQQQPVCPEGSPTREVKPAGHNPDCIFCKICSKEARAEILYEDSDFVCFVDRKPVSTHHYLVVPRQHLVAAGQLTSTHVSLVQHMADIGKQVLAEQGGEADEARLGFHWPPFIMVKHLHMHIISPVREMSWLNRVLVFRKDSYFFSAPDYLVNYIKAKPPQSKVLK